MNNIDPTSIQSLPIKYSPAKSEAEPNSLSALDSPTETVKIATTPFQSSVDENRSQGLSQRDSMMTILKEVPKAAESLYKSISKLEEYAKSSMPELNNTEWGVTIDENNEVVILGEDLSDKQRDLLTSAANEMGISSKAVAFRDNVLKAMKQDRGPLESTTHIGKYNLTNENFSDIVDLKELKSDSKLVVNPQFSVNGKNGYNPTSIIDALASQISSKLEPEFELHVVV